MKTATFTIQYEVEIPLDLPIEMIRKYPTNSTFLYEQKEVIITLKFRPTQNLNEEKYIEYLKQKFKKEYNATSIQTTTKTQE